ncbi:MAG TPA: tyrosine-type recombinase/integrase [Dehalococcoidia bacterium]|nr:tyrosine-type recombinase/integrase [Dehalococcoidia bacterium]
MQYRSESTKKTYEVHLRLYLKWLDGRKQDARNAQEYIDHMLDSGRKPNYIATAANALRAHWKDGGKALSLHAPTPEVGYPKYLTIDQIYKLLASAKTALEKCILTLLFDTGARISEVLNLHLEDINLEERLLHVTRKGGREEDVLLGEKGQQALEIWLKTRKSKDKRVFMDYTYNDIYYILKETAKRAGIENFAPHMLRHSLAFYMLSKGKDLHDIQEILGHRSIATTANIYARRKPEHLRKVKPDW